MAASDEAISACFRRIVRTAISNGAEITVNTARDQAEDELGLDHGYFKSHSTWKVKSRDIINTAVEEEEQEQGESEESAPPPITKIVGKSKTEGKKPTVKAGTKRTSSEQLEKPSRKRKKQETIQSDVTDEESRGTSTNGHDVVDKESEDEGDGDGTKDWNARSKDVDAARENKDDRGASEMDESDTSSLLDDPPPQKRKRRRKSASPRPKKTSSRPKAAPPGKELSADDETIKTLRSNLLKCGVRKLWHLELAPYATAKEKIRHLRSLLDEVGMTGRFSAEKARQIKESRELAAELEAARNFEQQWGTEGRGKRSRATNKIRIISEDDQDHDQGNDDVNDEGEDGDEYEEKPTDTTKPRLPKGLVDFGDSGDEGSD